MARDINDGDVRIDSGLPSLSLPVTLSAWGQIRDTDSTQLILNCRSLSNGWVQIYHNGSVLRAQTSAFKLSSAAYSTLDTWYHACGVFRSTSNRQVYLNGTGAIANTDTDTVSLGTMDEIFVGNNNYSGIIADAAVWSAELSDDEIKALANGVPAIKIRPQSLYLHWPLWGIDSPEVDLSGNGYNGTLTGTSAANHPPLHL